MKKIYLGNDKNGRKIEIDFDKEKINFVLLAGQTASGKSIFHLNFYKELVEKYSPDEIGFVFLDMTKTDFYNWSSDYLIKPVISEPEEAINVLHEISDLKTDKKIFIHIEECDMVYKNRKGIESAFEKLKERDNIYTIYSTSRIDRGYLDKWIKDFINLKIVFAVATEEDSIFLLGSGVANHFNNTGEKILTFGNQQIFCQPFSGHEVELLKKFKL